MSDFRLTGIQLERLRNEHVITVPNFIQSSLVDSLVEDVLFLRSSPSDGKTSNALHGQVEWFELLPRSPTESEAQYESPSGRQELFKLVEYLRSSIEGSCSVELHRPLTELK